MKKFDCPSIWRYILATFALIVGCVAIICALFIAPPGIIDPTVLTAFGEALSFAGALVGIDATYRHKMFLHTKDDKPDSQN